MLELRPGCECCDRDLPPDSPDARRCSLECTFCVECADGTLRGRYPYCGGELVRRPIRPVEKLAKDPPSAKWIIRANCTNGAGSRVADFSLAHPPNRRHAE